MNVSWRFLVFIFLISYVFADDAITDSSLSVVPSSVDTRNLTAFHNDTAVGKTVVHETPETGGDINFKTVNCSEARHVLDLAMSDIEEINTKYGDLQREIVAHGFQLEAAVDRSSDVSDKANSILNIAVALGTIAAVFAALSSVMALVDWKRKSREHDDITKSFNELLLSFQSQYEGSIKIMRTKVDHFHRISRLFVAISSTNFDSELFYSELSQLKNVTDIDANFEYLLDWLNINRERFDLDVQELIDEIYEQYSK